MYVCMYVIDSIHGSSGCLFEIGERLLISNLRLAILHMMVLIAVSLEDLWLV